MTEPVDVERIARGLTPKQRAAIEAFSSVAVAVFEPASRFGVAGIVADALWHRNLLRRNADRYKWGRSVYSPTDLGLAVAAHLRAPTEGEG